MTSTTLNAFSVSVFLNDMHICLCLLSSTTYQSVLFLCFRSSFLNASLQLPIPRFLLKSPSETDSRWPD